MTDLGTTNIEDNAENPKRATVDGNSVEQHSIKDQIDAAAFKASNDAMAKNKRGFALQRFKASGSQ